MANAVLLSNFTGTHHYNHPATHRIHRLSRSLPSSILRLTPRLPSSNLTLNPHLHLQTTIAKSSSVDVQLMNHYHEADASPIWVDSILKPLKRCTIPLVIMLPLLLMSMSMSMSYPARACESCDWDTVNDVVIIEAALSEAGPKLRSNPKPLSMVEKFALYAFMAYFIVPVIFLFIECAIGVEHCWGATSVLKLQVGLLARQATPLQRGLKPVDICPASGSAPRPALKETANVLLRHPDYCISAHSCVHTEASINAGIRKLHQLYEEELEKFKEGQGHSQTSLGAGGHHNNDYVVVTILVAVLGEYTIPTIERRTDLMNALRMLESTHGWRIKGLKVEWTPQAENNTIRENLLKEPTLEAPRKQKKSMSAYLKSAQEKLAHSLKKLNYALSL